MLFLQIKQAEVALADGRLDEAYQLVQHDALRSHRRGQAIVTRLVDALVERGKAHLLENRAAQAMADCLKAQNLAGNLAAVLALRAEIHDEVISTDHQRCQEMHIGMLQTAAELVDSAIARDDVDRAVAELVRARGNGCNDHRLRELDGNLRSTLRRQIESALDEGRLDQIEPLMQRLTRLDADGLATQQLHRALEQARSAWMQLDAGRPDAARETLHRLAMQLPQAEWITEVLVHLAAADEAMTAVRIGPLGLLTMDQGEPPAIDGDSRGRKPAVADGHHCGHPPAAINSAGTQLPAKFIIHVDGAGSYLVLRQPGVTIGPISSAPVPDVALIADASAAAVKVERVEDDYFLRSGSAAGKLLATGDRITLSPRCVLRFSVPNPSSTSATLDLAAGRFPRADVRRVILLDRDLIVGPGGAAHIRVDHVTEPLVLHVRDDRLWHRTQQLQMKVPTTLNGVGVVVTME